MRTVYAVVVRRGNTLRGLKPKPTLLQGPNRCNVYRLDNGVAPCWSAFEPRSPVSSFSPSIWNQTRALSNRDVQDGLGRTADLTRQLGQLPSALAPIEPALARRSGLVRSACEPPGQDRRLLRHRGSATGLPRTRAGSRAAIGEHGVQRRRRDTARALNSAATPTDDDHTDDDRRAQRRPR